MMEPRQVEQDALFYEFSIESHVPADHLEQFPIRRNRRGFSNRHRSDSSCVLAKEAGMHGPSAFP